MFSDQFIHDGEIKVGPRGGRILISQEHHYHFATGSEDRWSCKKKCGASVYAKLTPDDEVLGVTDDNAA